MSSALLVCISLYHKRVFDPNIETSTAPLTFAPSQPLLFATLSSNFLTSCGCLFLLELLQWSNVEGEKMYRPQYNAKCSHDLIQKSFCPVSERFLTSHWSWLNKSGSVATGGSLQPPHLWLVAMFSDFDPDFQDYTLGLFFNIRFCRD